MEKYNRKDLIEICEKAFVSEDKWHDRDSESSQCQLGECYALLKAGCDFEVIYKDDICETNENTIWLYVYSHGFGWFESFNEPNERTRNEMEEHHYYLPTMKRLKEANGDDWY